MQSAVEAHHLTYQLWKQEFLFELVGLMRRLSCARAQPGGATMIDWFRSWHGAPTDPKWLGDRKAAGIAPGFAVAIAWALMDQPRKPEIVAA